MCQIMYTCALNVKRMNMAVLFNHVSSQFYFIFRKWSKVETIMTITEPVRDVAFAPNLGRSYHMLAIASKDVKVITLKPLR